MIRGSVYFFDFSHLDNHILVLTHLHGPDWDPAPCAGLWPLFVHRDRRILDLRGEWTGDALGDCRGGELDA